MSIEFIILSMNPGFDRWLVVHNKPPFETVVRADSVLKLVSGKGINLARVLSTFDFENYECLNIIGGEIGRLIEQSCRTEGLRTTSFYVADESRINFSVIRTFDRTIQTFNEPGPVLSDTEVNGYIDLVKKILLDKEEPYLVISGSASKGFSTAQLTDLIGWASHRGIKVCIDIGGEWLKSVVEHPIELLKINREEFHLAFGFDILERERLDEFKKKHQIRDLIITNGKHGSYAWNATGEKYHVTVKDLDDAVGFTVGCGDSFFAGYLLGVSQETVFKDRLLLANACGIANTRNYGPAKFSREDMQLSKNNVFFESF